MRLASLLDLLLQIKILFEGFRCLLHLDFFGKFFCAHNNLSLNQIVVNPQVSINAYFTLLGICLKSEFFLSNEKQVKNLFSMQLGKTEINKSEWKNDILLVREDETEIFKNLNFFSFFKSQNSENSFRMRAYFDRKPKTPNQILVLC